MERPKRKDYPLNTLGLLTYNGKLKEYIDQLEAENKELKKQNKCLCEICNQNEGKVNYTVCSDCEQYIINGERG